MWINPTESAAFWLSVLTDLRTRGDEDILIDCTDNLTDFTEAIHAAFPHTMTQLCIVHQIRNSAKFVVWKERKEFCADLKAIYDAPINKLPPMRSTNSKQNGATNTAMPSNRGATTGRT